MQPNSFDLPAVDQVGFVVANLDEAVRRYTPLFGEATTMDAEIEGADYRGKKVDCRLKLAMFRSGPVEIEFIEVVDGEAIHTEFLRAGRDGPHHVRFTVASFAEAAAKLEAAGMEAVFGKRFAPGLEFAYFEAADGTLWELFENNAD